jgi:hypothetical protein
MRDIIRTSNLLDVVPAMLKHPGTRSKHNGGAPMTKMIPLTQGKFALVDDEDFEWLNQYKWRLRNGYAGRDSSILLGPRRNILMHREVAGTPEGLFTDHANGNKLDNRRCNLRICNKSQNRAKLWFRWAEQEWI